MIIKAERTNIRFIVENDWKQVKEIWEDFNASEYARYDRPHNTDDADVEPRIAKWAAANNAGTEHMFFAVCVNDIIIGYIAFNKRIDGYEIGYCFRSAYHGKGYAKESLSALIEYLSGTGIKRFTAGTAVTNAPSAALLKSLGFRQIGTETISFYKDDHGNDIVFDGGIFELTK